MDESVFRKKNVEHISTPDQLDEYIRVSNPGVWVFLAAAIILLTGVCVWGCVGTLDTRVDAAVQVENGRTVCYVAEENAQELRPGLPVLVEGKEYTAADVSSRPEQAADDMGEYLLHLCGSETGGWIYTVTLETNLDDGVYPAQVVVDRISPVSLLFN